MSGRDLIALGWKPGPEFKKILDAVQVRQLEGLLTSREQAMDWVASQRDLVDKGDIP